MTTKDEALQMALEALEFSSSYLNELSGVLKFSKKAKPGSTAWHVQRAIKACRAALAQQDEAVVTTTTIEALEQEIYENTRLFVPTAVMQWMLSKYHTAPPKRKPLTDEQIREMADGGIYVGTVFADGTKGIALDKVTVCDFARAIEAAHGIGVEHDTP